MGNMMAVILAAGEGKRMKSKNSKVVHPVCGKPVVAWVCEAVQKSGVQEIVVVVGHRAEQVMDCLGEGVQFALQEQQLGTGHAVIQAEKYLKGRDGVVLVLNGDTPLITERTIARTVEAHEKSGNSATVITADLEDPTGYGRIIRDGAGDVIKIVEHKDADEAELAIREINSGMYCFTIGHLMEALTELGNNNSQGEYYLTDTLEILLSKGLKVGAVKVGDRDEILGINDRVQLHEASAIMQRRINTGHMKEGVTILDAEATYISGDAVIGRDAVIYPGTIIEGRTTIGEDAIIGPGARIVDSHIGRGSEVLHSVVLSSTVDEDSHVGPYAYLRPGSKIGKDVKIGDFVEVKNSQIGDGTKVSHLTYVGDAQVGKNVNLGCGVVFVNYDGVKKNRTIVGDNAFIGCNVNLISPVEVKENAYIAAGSTITEEVPENALAIARSRQVVKEGWVKKKGINRGEST